jgi:hypothetical protein
MQSRIRTHTRSKLASIEEHAPNMRNDVCVKRASTTLLADLSPEWETLIMKQLLERE